MFCCVSAVEATLRGDPAPPRVDSISAEGGTPSASHRRPNDPSSRSKQQRNLPPIPSTAPELPGRNHVVGRAIQPPSVARVSSNGDPQVPPPRGTRRTSSASTPQKPATSPTPLSTSTTKPPPAAVKPQAPPKPSVRSQKPPVSGRPKPSAPKPSASSINRLLENMTIENKIRLIQEKGSALIEQTNTEPNKPGLGHQLDELASVVDSLIADANASTNDSSVQFKRHVNALRSQAGYLRDSSLQNDPIRLVRVIEMITTKSQQLSSHLH